MDDWEIEEVALISSKLKSAVSKANLTGISDTTIFDNAVKIYLQEREFENMSEDSQEE